MKKLLLTVLCLLSALMLTACHTDNDPWPVDGGLPPPAALPAVTLVPESTEVQIPRTYLTPDAAPANTPVPADTPGEDHASGING